ncbi:hypothetical protein [Sphingobium aromaticiconvertens]|uniref:hypothetical protein n=1 Tax=Sphingobium aromaticiconvertens TaxID=365341 RepID=UPI00301740B6
MKKIVEAPTAPDAASVVQALSVPEVLPPRVVDVSSPADLRLRIRVVDAITGQTIDKVTYADVDAGKVTRFAVEGGNLVRKDDRFVKIDEDREIRIEWNEEPAA